ncbi:multidrug effflux MFS transporter [Marinibacterium profundimaris]|uniref:Bcr/CflA family efflux transporter n=1 Tax=Marinibacterium profundimaris TaxID=1679460 RepID=A0A225NYH1_9RHOB|nr:multidrug effflux MFS transporter [Marinibacterium profundimaris]OWU77216.1 major facilitator transporter [Marinibacterium profundimaris]
MFRIALMLGLLSVVGPFAIDMYLPALPRIAEDLAATEAQIQFSLTAYFVSYGVAQIFYGPLADQTGRKLPILLGAGIFLLGAVGAAMAPSAAALTLWRAVQGFGGAAMMVMPRAIVRDLYRGPDATRLMAMVMLVISVSPMLAPMAGSLVIAVSGWRVVFVFMATLALIAIAITLFALPETLPKERRVPVNLRKLAGNAKALMTDGTFMGLTFIGGFGMASFFVFLASASFVYMGQFGMDSTQFSMAFALNALGFFGASQFAGPAAARMGVTRVVRLGVGLFFLSNMVLLCAALAGLAPLPVIMTGLFCANAGLGLVIPTTAVLALEPHGDKAGLASSLGGTLQMLTGGGMIMVSGLFFDGTALPMVMATSICATMAMGLALVFLSRETPAPVVQDI